MCNNRSNAVHNVGKIVKINQSGVNENGPFIPENASKSHWINTYVVNFSGNYFKSNLTLAATQACVGMTRRSQVTVLYYKYSTPGQTEAHAVLYSSQQRVCNSFHMPRFCLTIMRQKKGITFYNSAVVEWWTSISLKNSSNEQFLLALIYYRAQSLFDRVIWKKLPLFVASLLPY